MESKNHDENAHSRRQPGHVRPPEAGGNKKSDEKKKKTSMNEMPNCYGGPRDDEYKVCDVSGKMA